MADKPSSVRLLQQYLRRAGECITAGDLDAAAGHVEAALAVDASSLAALTLRDRIARMRSISPEPGNAPISHEYTPASDSKTVHVPPGRFVPNGVNPHSWMSFEGRIEERRFQSLLRSARAAIERSDILSARLAVEEARELRPDAPEVEALSDAVAALPIPEVLSDGGSFVRSRTFRAAGILVFGVTLMLALDWTRADPPRTGAATPARPAAALDSDLLASVSRGQTDAPVLDRVPAPVAESAVQAPTPTPRAVAPLPAAASASTVRTVESNPATAPVVVPGGQRLAALAAQPPPVPARGETPDDYVAVPRVTVQGVVTSRAADDARPASPPQGEIPDDYVVPQVTSRSTVTAPTPAPPVSLEASAAPRDGSGNAPSSNLPLGNAVREAPPTASLGGGRATAAAPSAAAVIPRDDRSQVLTAVDAYARAFERLDARAARAVWPTVDERNLSRAFNELESQSFSFSGPCNVNVQGARATASCRGTARYVVKVGNREPRTEPRTWDIRLSRSGEEWFIDSVRVASR